MSDTARRARRDGDRDAAGDPSLAREQTADGPVFFEQGQRDARSFHAIARRRERNGCASELLAPFLRRRFSKGLRESGVGFPQAGDVGLC